MILPLSLPPDFNTELPVGLLATVSGFGGNDYNTRTKPTSLQFVSIPIVTCYGKANMEDMMCAGKGGKKGKNAWAGDSGGPLVVIPGKLRFMGIVRNSENKFEAKIKRYTEHFISI